MVREERRRGELVGEKLRRGILVGGREGKSTPPPTWKFGLGQTDGTIIQDPTNSKNILSARKLGANLWESQPQVNLRVGSMRNENGSTLSHHHHHHHHNQDNVFQAQARSSSKQANKQNWFEKKATRTIPDPTQSKSRKDWASSAASISC
ncbi:hypothetical protein OROGR_031890 [Orobanche gracilis]